MMFSRKGTTGFSRWRNCEHLFPKGLFPNPLYNISVGPFFDNQVWGSRREDFLLDKT